MQSFYPIIDFSIEGSNDFYFQDLILNNPEGVPVDTINDADINFKVPGFKYFALFNPYSGTYMRTDADGKNYRSNSITHECIYEFKGNWNGLNENGFFIFF